MRSSLYWVSGGESSHMAPVKQPEPADRTEPVTRTVDAPPSPDHLAVLGIETCIHCEQPRSSHHRPFYSCWGRTTFFEAGPSFMARLEVVRQAHRVLNDLEESVNALVYGLESLHDDFSCARTLMQAFQRRQEDQGGTDPEKPPVQP